MTFVLPGAVLAFQSCDMLIADYTQTWKEGTPLPRTDLSIEIYYNICLTYLFA
jgi:hypothetical protein